VGFIAGQNSSLWDLAKEYQTSPESIMELNGLATQEIHPADRLILVKQVDGLQ
jgi:LysM repeat protein